MTNNQLSLDEILAKCKGEGIFWDSDDGYGRLKKYKFVLDERIAFNIVSRIIDGLYSTSIYSLLGGRVRDLDREIYLEVGFRKRSIISNPRLIESIKRFVQDRIRSRDHYKTLHHFVTLYFLKPSAAEALREKDGGIEQAPEGKTIFVIDNPDSMRTDYRPHFLTLMNIFYSAYERFKTPSETSPIH